MRDRWTGQAWTSTYGKDGGILYSGEQNPVPSQNEISYKTSQILNSPEKVQEKQAIEQDIEFYNQEMKNHEEGHKEYVWLVAEQKKQQPTTSYRINGENTPNYITGGELQVLLDRLNSGRVDYDSLNDNFKQKIDRVVYIPKMTVSEIPTEIIESDTYWNSAYQNSSGAKGKLRTLPFNAQSQADFELRTWAWKERNIATYIWIGLLVTMASLTLFLLKRNKNQSS